MKAFIKVRVGFEGGVTELLSWKLPRNETGFAPTCMNVV